MNIREIGRKLEQRAHELEKMIGFCEKRLKNASGEYLWTRKDRGAIRYYAKHAPSRLRYLREKSDFEKIRELEDKAYCKAFCKEAYKELNQIKQTLKDFAVLKDPENVFLMIPPYRVHLIKPYVPPYSEVPSVFKGRTNHKYISSDSPFTTKAGEKVRSKSELIIANRLFDAGIPYRYELNTVIGEDEGMMMVNPDFTVYNCRTGERFIWEHFGMMNKTDYCLTFQIKLENYERHGVFPGRNLIMTFETTERPLNTESLNLIIDEYLK